MRRIAFAVVVLLVPISLAFPQLQTTKLKIRAVLVDKDLNQKPVPKLALTLIRTDDSGGGPITVKTGFDGLGEADLQAGHYKLSTVQIDFQDKKFSWSIEFDVHGRDVTIELSNDNATIEQLAESERPRAARITDDLTGQFKRLQNTVVTVWSEIGHGTGFIVDRAGLIITNQHVIGPSEYIAVQFDEKLKIAATLLSFDPGKDVAVLWADISAFPDAAAVGLPDPKSNTPIAVEGEKVLTIGSPLSRRKIMTTGIVSKVEERAIISDVNINHGNSGGPLFNSLGVAIGITTFKEQPSAVSGVVRIEEALPLLAQAREKMKQVAKPDTRLLPVEPVDPFPVDAIKQSLETEKFDWKRYWFSEGNYDVTLDTPILTYHITEGRKVAAAKEKEKRTKHKDEAVKGTFEPLQDLKNWAEYVGEYRAVFTIEAAPKLRETTGSLIMRGLTRGYSQAKIRYKSDFYKMRLLCGGKEVEPIQPAKAATLVDVQSLFINATDATYKGIYIYPYDAISGSCGEVVLEIYSEKDPNKATVKKLDEKTIARIVADFEPYKAAHQKQ